MDIPLISIVLTTYKYRDSLVTTYVFNHGVLLFLFYIAKLNHRLLFNINK
jgi:hypothetical protein